MSVARARWPWEPCTPELLRGGQSSQPRWSAAQITISLAVGQRLTMTPLLIFIAVFLWLRIWGVIGALLTVPILVCVKIVLDRRESTRAIGMLTGR